MTLTKQNRPTTEEIKCFLEVFNKLADFEVMTRNIRGSAVFQEHELPIPDVAKVLVWLKSLK